MLRLHAVAASVDDEGFDGYFVEPTLIEPWVQYLKAIQPRLNPGTLLPGKLRRNIGHRLQLLEFECALLLLNLETKKTFPGRSTLHETIAVMKMQQIAVSAHSILEGIAGHLVRVDKDSRGEVVNAEDKIAVATWRVALVDEVMASATAPEVTAENLNEHLIGLTGWRDRLHLDRIEPGDPLHFNQFTYSSCFIPAHQTLRMVLNALNSNWPPDTCLNQDLAAFA